MFDIDEKTLNEIQAAIDPKFDNEIYQNSSCSSKWGYCGNDGCKTSCEGTCNTTCSGNGCRACF